MNLLIYGNTAERTWRLEGEKPPAQTGDMPWMLLASIPLVASIRATLKEFSQHGR